MYLPKDRASDNYKGIGMWEESIDSKINVIHDEPPIWILPPPLLKKSKVLPGAYVQKYGDINYKVQMN